MIKTNTRIDALKAAVKIKNFQIKKLEDERDELLKQLYTEEHELKKQLNKEVGVSYEIIDNR